MKRLWAPWRIEYLESAKPEGCILCDKMAQDRDRENHILHRGENGVIMLNRYPYSNGHLMIVPYRHVPSPEDLSDEEGAAVMQLVKLSIRLLKNAFRPEGFNIGANIGKVAGAGIDSHVHIHVVPRWGGDTNFMPVVSEMRVIPEGLDQTYSKLEAVLSESLSP